MANPTLTTAILAVVDQQMRDSTSPETQRTFDRLVAQGYAPEDALHLRYYPVPSSHVNFGVGRMVNPKPPNLTCLVEP